MAVKLINVLKISLVLSVNKGALLTLLDIFIDNEDHVVSPAFVVPRRHTVAPLAFWKIVGSFLFVFIFLEVIEIVKHEVHVLLVVFNQVVDDLLIFVYNHFAVIYLVAGLFLVEPVGSCLGKMLNFRVQVLVFNCCRHSALRIIVTPAAIDCVLISDFLLHFGIIIDYIRGFFFLSDFKIVDILGLQVGIIASPEDIA